MKVKTKKNEVLDLQCQQYSTGLYIVLYKNGRLYSQYGVNTTRDIFLKDLKDGKLELSVIEA